MYTLPNGYLFIAANRIAMLYDWKKNIERRVKDFPNGVTITCSSSPSCLLYTSPSPRDS